MRSDLGVVLLLDVVDSPLQVLMRQFILLLEGGLVHLLELRDLL